MYVCICHAVTDTDIRREAADGVRRFDQLQARTGCSTGCGCCEDEARKTLNQCVHTVQTTTLPTVNAA